MDHMPGYKGQPVQGLVGSSLSAYLGWRTMPSTCDGLVGKSNLTSSKYFTMYL